MVYFKESYLYLMQCFSFMLVLVLCLLIDGSDLMVIGGSFLIYMVLVGSCIRNTYQYRLQVRSIKQWGTAFDGKVIKIEKLPYAYIIQQTTTGYKDVVRLQVEYINSDEESTIVYSDLLSSLMLERVNLTNVRVYRWKNTCYVELQKGIKRKVQQAVIVVGDQETDTVRMLFLNLINRVSMYLLVGLVFVFLFEFLF